MTKSDNSIKNICIAAIKRHTISPYDFVATEFYDHTLSTMRLDAILSQVQLIDEELPIASTYFNDNWTLVTTQRVITLFGTSMQQIAISEVIKWDLGFFNDKKDITIRAKIYSANFNQIECLIETGRASMIIIYAIRSNPLLKI